MNTEQTHKPLQLDTAWVTNVMSKRSFCTIATTNTDGSPHAASVLYVAVGDAFYISTLRSSRKARNIARQPRVSISIPVRRVPAGPPSSIQFTGLASLRACDDAEIVQLASSGALKKITSHGELELADGCIVKLTRTSRLNTYGLGMPLHRLIRNPLDAAGHAGTAFAWSGAQ
jgi:hypothetical protein